MSRAAASPTDTAAGASTWSPGDTITVPAGVYHGAVNLGEGEAVMTIVFDTPDRQTDFSVLEPGEEGDHG